MFSGTRLYDMPGRLATGLFILNSGLGKRAAGQERAAGLHALASGAYPFLKQMPPEKFVSTLSKVEIGLGVALLTPLVPTAVAGLALAGFSGGLVTMYLRSPSLREPGSIRPNDQGTAIAKDSWMLGMSLGFLIDALGRRRRR